MRIAGQRRQRPLSPGDPRQSAAKRQGLTRPQIEALRLAQSGRCALCRQSLGYDFVVDHDHELAARHGHNSRTGCQRCCRGLLHRRCNSLLGAFGDDPDRLMAAADYVRRLRMGAF